LAVNRRPQEVAVIVLESRKVYGRGDMDDLGEVSRVFLLCVIVQRDYRGPAYMIEAALLEKLGPALLISVVRHDYDIDLALPCRQGLEDRCDGGLASHGATDGMAGVKEGVDDVRGDEAVGTGD
jgi:hypothetical protein